MQEPIRLDRVETAVAALGAGRAVVVVDDADRENEGDIVFAADAATPELVAFTVRYTSGVLCATMPGDWADRLELPPMTAVNHDPKQTAYTVTCDAAQGITTGISAADRAVTLGVLAAAESAPTALTRPGHVFPLRAVPGGVRQRRGHTEASVPPPTPSPKEHTDERTGSTDPRPPRAGRRGPRGTARGRRRRPMA